MMNRVTYRISMVALSLVLVITASVTSAPTASALSCGWNTFSQTYLNCSPYWKAIAYQADIGTGSYYYGYTCAPPYGRASGFGGWVWSWGMSVWTTSADNC